MIFCPGHNIAILDQILLCFLCAIKSFDLPEIISNAHSLKLYIKLQIKQIILMQILLTGITLANPRKAGSNTVRRHMAWSNCPSEE